MTKFNRRSTAALVTDGVDLIGKNIVITGVNSGLGFESMRVLASRGAHIIGLARTQEKAAEACGRVAGATTPLACDLSDFVSVAACADHIIEMNLPVDVLLCNAGIMALPERQTAHGLELQFATNHMGHFLLVNKLLDKLKAAESGRVVVVSSLGYKQAPKCGIEFNDLGASKNYNAWTAYGQSKLANILFARELAVRLEGTGATANAVHPGVIQTNLSRSMDGFMSMLISRLASVVSRSVECGAATQCYLAANPEASAFNGEMFADCKPHRLPKGRVDPAVQQRLWEVSEAAVAEFL